MPNPDFDQLLNKALNGKESAIYDLYEYIKSDDFSPEEITQALDKIEAEIANLDLKIKGNALYLKGVLHHQVSEKVSERVISLYNQAEALGNPFAMNELATIYYGQKNDQKAIEYLEKAVKCGGGAAIKTNLANLYARSDTVKNIPRAIELYEEAISLRNLDAMFNRASMLLDGIGGPVDKIRAVALLKKAAMFRHPESMKTLAKIYIEGADGTKYLKAYRLMNSYAYITEKNVDNELKNIADKLVAHTKLLLKNDVDAELFHNLWFQIDKINTYGEEIGSKKGERLKKLAQKLTNKVDAFIVNALDWGYTVGASKGVKADWEFLVVDFICDFRRVIESNEDMMKTHREIWKPIVANILIALSGIGLVLILAKVFAEAWRSFEVHNKFSVNNAFFFAQTKSQKLAEDTMQAKRQWIDEVQKFQSFSV